MSQKTGEAEAAAPKAKPKAAEVELKAAPQPWTTEKVRLIAIDDVLRSIKGAIAKAKAAAAKVKVTALHRPSARR